MSELQPKLLQDGSPVVPTNNAHKCYFESGFSRPYVHSAVGVLLMNDVGELALVRRSENQTREPGKLVLPGGYQELEQTLVDAALTEAREETGYSAIPGTLRLFAILDGPTTLPGRNNEVNCNNVMIFTAQAGDKVNAHDANEISSVLWTSINDLPSREEVGFGHYDIIGMFLRHQQSPFDALPIMPSQMSAEQLLPKTGTYDKFLL